MKTFEDLAIQKKTQTQECKEFTKELKNINNDRNVNSEIDTLIYLLNCKKRMYDSLKCDNGDQISLGLKDIDEKIYRQIYILEKDENLKISDQSKYAKKYLSDKSSEIKAQVLKEIINFIFLHKWLSTIVFFAFGIFGVLIYFENPLNDTRYISQLQLILISVTNIVFAFLWSAFFVFLAYSYVMLEKSGDFKNPKLGFLYPSWFILLMSLLVMWIPTHLLKDKIDILCNLLISFAITYIAISLCIKFRKNSKIMTVLYMLILAFIALLSIIISLYFKINFFSVFLLLMSLIFIWLIATTSITNKTDIKFNIYLTIVFILLGAIPTAPNFTMSLIGYKEVDYKFISIDKKALKSLPDGICKENCNITAISYIDGNFTYKNNDTNTIHSIKSASNECFSFLDENQTIVEIPKDSKIIFKDKTLDTQKDGNAKTYKNISLKSNPKICMTYIKNQDNDTFKIYNIKTLSTLGKFYLLETKDGKKFEIDSNLIYGKQRELIAR